MWVTSPVLEESSPELSNQGCLNNCKILLLKNQSGHLKLAWRHDLSRPWHAGKYIATMSFPLIDIFIFLYWGAVGAAPKHWCDFLIHEVTILDCGYINFLFILGQSPCNWRTMMPGNVVLTIFHTQQICDHAWKTVRFKFLSIIVLQLQGDLSHILFPTFQDLFPAIE